MVTKDIKIVTNLMEIEMTADLCLHALGLICCILITVKSLQTTVLQHTIIIQGKYTT